MNIQKILDTAAKKCENKEIGEILQTRFLINVNGTEQCVVVSVPELFFKELSDTIADDLAWSNKVS